MALHHQTPHSDDSHAPGNALLPVITIIGTELEVLLGGVIVTETVFALNGVGSLLIYAIIRRDLPVVQSLVLLRTFAFVVVNLLVDLVYVWLDPRITYHSYLLCSHTLPNVSC